MLIIWRALVTYLDNNLRAGKSVNIRRFGAFTFDIDTDLPVISRREINPNVDIESQRLQRKHIHHLR
jgi:CCDC81 eukaryotic HU domain 1